MSIKDDWLQADSVETQRGPRIDVTLDVIFFLFSF